MARFSTEADTALSLLSHPAAVWQQASATGQCVGRRPPGAGGPAEEVGEHLEFGFGVSGTDLVQRGVHPRVEAQHLGAAVAERPDPHRAAVGLVAVTRHPAAAFQPVEDAGDGGRVQPGPPGEGARAERAVAADEVKAVEVHVVQVKTPADVVVEQGQLDAQLAQRLLDRRGQPAPVPRGPVVPRFYLGSHVICFPYYMIYREQDTRSKP